MINWARSAYYYLKGLNYDPSEKGYIDSPSSPELYFKSISILHNTPKNETVTANDFYIVIYKRNPMWALFQCPCGCGKVISLSLQSVHNPFWKVTISRKGVPTLFPSVWQNSGCLSHFWISGGTIYWCRNTGMKPISFDDIKYRG